MANDNLSHDPALPRPSRRGFAGMDAEKRRLIARKGGQAVSRNRQHMSEIGRRGGVASGGSNRQAEDSGAGPSPAPGLGTTNLQ
jgi:general stress protein YciG